jgi:hypothetical protein
MHACRQRQVAFNQRISKNEEEIAAINSGLADFLQDMQMDMPLFACVNVGGRMRGTQQVCGQLWPQEDRQMSATCLPIDLGNSREEVALSGIVDVLAWRQALETSQDPDYLRPSQHVTVYPKFLDRLDAVLSSGDIGMDSCQERWPAYEAILLQSLIWPVNTRLSYEDIDPRATGSNFL